MKAMRKQSESWMQARLRRIDCKLFSREEKGVTHSPFIDISKESTERCRVRGHRLACDLQILIGHKNRLKGV